MTARGEEGQLLEAACATLGAKLIIRLCSVQEHPSISRPLQRLIHTAGAVQQAVDMSGEKFIVLLIMYHSCGGGGGGGGGSICQLVSFTMIPFHIELFD